MQPCAARWMGSLVIAGPRGLGLRVGYYPNIGKSSGKEHGKYYGSYCLEYQPYTHQEYSTTKETHGAASLAKSVWHEITSASAKHSELEAALIQLHLL